MMEVVNVYEKFESVRKTVEQITDDETRKRVVELLEKVPIGIYEELESLFEEGYVPLISWDQFGDGDFDCVLVPLGIFLAKR
jgi:hypothetical protein